MRHAQVSTTMRYGNAYMTEKRKAYEPWLQMVFPAEVQKKRKAATLPLSVGLVGVFLSDFVTPKATLSCLFSACYGEQGLDLRPLGYERP